MSPLALGRWNGNRNELIEYSLAFVLGQLRRERLGESFVVPWPRSEVNISHSSDHVMGRLVTYNAVDASRKDQFI
jgi:hypothetical protein